ncbi:MAG: hypothetical protein Q4615_04875 [Paracoccus aminovorans]|nr:hypothetical protein [Paracoccus aminovorans]
MIDWLSLASGLYLSAGAFIVDTKDPAAGLLFRIIPGVIGFGLIARGAAGLGLL